MRRSAVIALVATLAVTGCGGAEEVEPEPPAAAADKEVPGGADPADVRVIDDWVRTLRDGDVDGAAEYFAIPSVAENGPLLIEIDDRADARRFNASLPCGAELTRAVPEGDFVVATFLLTERPGPGTCGSGAGALAQTAFVIEDGLIAEWRRVGAGGAEAPSTTS